MHEPNEINNMMRFFKGEDEEIYESMEFEAVNEEINNAPVHNNVDFELGYNVNYLIDDSIFDEPEEDAAQDVVLFKEANRFRPQYDVENRLIPQHDTEPMPMAKDNMKIRSAPQPAIENFFQNSFEDALKNTPQDMHCEKCNLEDAYLRVLNASPGSPKYDIVYEGSQKITLTRAIGYSRITDYRTVKTGIAKINIYLAGRNTCVDSFYIELPQSGHYTLILCGTKHKLLPIITFDKVKPEVKTNASVRLINLSPGSDQVDLLLNNQPMLNNVTEQSISNYVDIEPDIYNLKLLCSDSKENMLTGKNVILQQNKSYTVYVLGFIQGYPRMAFAVSIDGQ